MLSDVANAALVAAVLAAPQVFAVWTKRTCGCRTSSADGGRTRKQVPGDGEPRGGSSRRTDAIDLGAPLAPVTDGLAWVTRHCTVQRQRTKRAPDHIFGTYTL